MDYIDLVNHFENENQKMFEENDKSAKREPFTGPFREDNFGNFFVEYFYDLYFLDIIQELTEVTELSEYKLQKHLSFYIGPESEEEFCIGELKRLSELFFNNYYAGLFSVDNFHNEIYGTVSFRAISAIVFLKNSEIINKWKEDDDICDGLDRALHDVFKEISEGFKILIEIKLLKNKLKILKGRKNGEEADELKEKKISFTRNQIVLLFDVLGMTKNIEEMPLSAQAKILATLTGYNEKNIKNSLEGLKKKPNELSTREKQDIKKAQLFAESLG
jgi:hypothetical protein